MNIGGSRFGIWVYIPIVSTKGITKIVYFWKVWRFQMCLRAIFWGFNPGILPGPVLAVLELSFFAKALSSNLMCEGSLPYQPFVFHWGLHSPLLLLSFFLPGSPPFTASPTASFAASATAPPTASANEPAAFSGMKAFWLLFSVFLWAKVPQGRQKSK
jgi:hypothetical protein